MLYENIMDQLKLQLGSHFIGGGVYCLIKIQLKCHIKGVCRQYQ